MTPEPDALADLLNLIRDGGWSATHELTGLPDAAPVVQVLGLPGRATHEAWGGKTLGRAKPYDVIVYGRSDVEASDMADAVAAHVEGAHWALFVVLDSLPHETREPNPDLWRYQFTVTVNYRV